MRCAEFTACRLYRLPAGRSPVRTVPLGCGSKVASRLLQVGEEGCAHPLPWGSWPERAAVALGPGLDVLRSCQQSPPDLAWRPVARGCERVAGGGCAGVEGSGVGGGGSAAGAGTAESQLADCAPLAVLLRSGFWASGQEPRQVQIEAAVFVVPRGTPRLLLSRDLLCLFCGALFWKGKDLGWFRQRM